MSETDVFSVGPGDFKRVKEFSQVLLPIVVRFYGVDVGVDGHFAVHFGAVDVDFERDVLFLVAKVAAEPDG